MASKIKNFWTVLETRRNEERIAEAHAERQGHQVYLPRYRSPERIKGRVVPVTKILFTNYVFVRIGEFWAHLRGTKGVLDVVLGTHGPAVFPEKQMELLRSREDDDGFIVVKQQEPFRLGQKLRYEFGGTIMSATYEGLTEDHRVRVLFDLLGRRIRSTVDASHLQAA